MLWLFEMIFRIDSLMGGFWYNDEIILLRLNRSRFESQKYFFKYLKNKIIYIDPLAISYWQEPHTKKKNSFLCWCGTNACSTYYHLHNISITSGQVVPKILIRWELKTIIPFLCGEVFLISSWKIFTYAFCQET